MYDKIGSIVINLLRPETTINCLASLKKYANGIRIYCGDQDSDLDLKKFCKLNDIVYVILKKDCGIGVARNKLVEMALSDGCRYFMWGDNDFIYNENLNLEHALHILDENKSIGVVGGSLIENGKLSHYERYMYYDKPRKILTFVPLHESYPKNYMCDDIKYNLCDITFNFCLAKAQVWKSRKVRWNTKIKVRFEHSYWFLMLQLHSKWKVAYCKSFQAIHKKFRTPSYDKFRNRDSDSLIYSKSLGINVMFAIGEQKYDFTLLGQQQRELEKQENRNLQKKTPSMETIRIEDNDTVKTLVEKVTLERQSSDTNLSQESIERFFQSMKENNFKIIVLKQSCLSLIKYGQFNVDFLNLGIEADITEESSNIMVRLSEQHKINCKFETYLGRTKIRQWQSFDINIPLPVLGYLAKVFGSGWNS